MSHFDYNKTNLIEVNEVTINIFGSLQYILPCNLCYYHFMVLSGT